MNRTGNGASPLAETPVNSEAATGSDLDPDPVRSNVHLPLRARFFPLGFPVDLRTNSWLVIQAAQQSWHRFQPEFPVESLHFEIDVAEGGERPQHRRPTFRSRQHLMSIVLNQANFMQCDFERGYCCGSFTSGLVDDFAGFHHRFLEPAALTMLSQRHLAPIHGALVASKGSGILLCGDSAAGKSTLAFTCARAGWDLISDDAVYLVRRQQQAYCVGNPFTIRFRDHARFLFPELYDYPSAIRLNGKYGFELPSTDLGLNVRTGHTVGHVIFLARKARETAKLLPFSKEAAFEAWTRFLHHGSEQVRQQQSLAYERLLTTNISTLIYSNLDDALCLLDQLAAAGSPA